MEFLLKYLLDCHLDIFVHTLWARDHMVKPMDGKYTGKEGVNGSDNNTQKYIPW